MKELPALANDVFSTPFDNRMYTCLSLEFDSHTKHLKLDIVSYPSPACVGRIYTTNVHMETQTAIEDPCYCSRFIKFISSRKLTLSPLQTALV